MGTGGGVLKSTDGSGAWPRASTAIELQYNELSDSWNYWQVMLERQIIGGASYVRC